MPGIGEYDAIFYSNATSIILVALVTALIAMWMWSQQKPGKDFPPGPRGWPILGNILEFSGKKPPYVIFMEHGQKYGNIFSIRMGQKWAVVLNGAETIREALVKKVEFANRATSYSINLFAGKGKDLLFGQYTPSWKLQRKIANTAFRSLATGNDERFEKLVTSVIPGLSELLNSKGSEAFDPSKMLSFSIYNILATICFGKQYNFDSPDLLTLIKVVREGMELVGNGLIADFIPILEYVSTPAARKLGEFFGEFSDLVQKELDEHRTKYSETEEPKDLIEMLFQAQNEMREKGEDEMELITETHIRQIVLDIFSAGVDTSSVTMHWSVALMAEFPDIQARVAAEVDMVVGRNRLPSLSDRENLPYTLATLYEVMRFSSVVPLALPHATSQDVTIGDYTIPGGISVLVNLYSVHYDEKLWDEPKKFKPEHFLDDSGKVILHHEGFMPFSIGRRACLGESVAKAELFLLFSWLFQHFKFQKAPGTEDQNYSEGYAMALTHMPKPYKVVVEKRFP